MKAMILPQCVSLDETDSPLEMVEMDCPQPTSHEVLIQVSTCGVCHTELDEIEGRTAPPEFPMVLGHEIVGRIVEVGPAVETFKVGDRVGVGWIHSSCGGDQENLSPEFRATGRDAFGGYAEFTTVSEDYAYPIPEAFDDEQAAPLLCAGAIGYRALKLTNLENGQRLGLTGFGGSGHQVLQLARHLYPETKISVFARDDDARKFARELGATWAGDTADRAPDPLHAIIDTTPAWKPVVEAMKNLVPGGRLVINAIRKEAGDQEYLQNLNYHEDLWMEREIKSVANITANDIREFLPIAAEIPIQPTVEVYDLADANRAIMDLKHGPVRGAKVLRVSQS
ncbi:MAG: zinc-dependent alcohol dehydrogenase family protein [Planctomycetaceae bacterium]|nr:zinc-dependent alcohol dehydrogenase family protein [Planctomycetaceae bacterium]